MKPNGWKPLVIIQCYEDRQQTLALRKVAPPAQEQRQESADVAKGPPPPPPMPVEDGSSKPIAEVKSSYAKYNGANNGATNSVNGKIESNGSTTANGFLNGKINYGIPNGKSNSALTNGTKSGNIVNIKTCHGTMNGKTYVPLANGAIKKSSDVVSDGMANGTSMNGKPNGTIKRTPTPDYETSNIETMSKLNLKSHAQTAEVGSIESYKMKNPSSPLPKPPPTYFKRPPNGTATMKKIVRPVSITIGEYPSRVLRKEPSKLEFLSGEGNSEVDQAEQAPIGSRLQSELAMTLSRSNLRKKTELKAKIDSNGNKAVDNDSDVEPDKNFHIRYGNNLLPTPPHVTIPKVPLVKTNSHPISQHIAMLAGKVAGRQETVEQQ